MIRVVGTLIFFLFSTVSSYAATVDNSDSQFSVNGYWPASSFIAGYYGSNYRYSAPGSGAKAAIWRFDVSAGRYQISAQWSASPNRASNAAYAIVNNGIELGTEYADQRSNGGDFNPLGAYDLEAGSLEVVLTDAADGYVIADAVRIGMNPSVVRTDVCIYGGTAGGAMAAYAAAEMGVSVVLVEPGAHLGGMTTGGLSATDIGDPGSITGLTRTFYDRLRQIYGGTIAGETHEPHVAEELINDMLAERPVTIYFGHRLKSVTKSNDQWIRQVVFEDAVQPGRPTITIAADVFIDAGYEGDLMAGSGVSYIVGRESNAQYGEEYNGIRWAATMPAGVDPYVLPGDPSSGILPFSGITTGSIGGWGAGDNRVQSYCFRLCMTQEAANRLEVLPPAGYDPDDFELFLRSLLRREPENLNDIFLIKPLPNGKWDWNNREQAGVSLDLVGENHAYPDGDYETRAMIRAKHLYYTAGLLYLLGHDERVPLHIRNEMQTWGLCRDEFQDTGGWPHQLYVREARRMIGRYVLTEANCALTVQVYDGIAQGSYPIDSHMVQRYIDGNGRVHNEGGFFNYPTGQIAAYDIPYRSITPQAIECRNLIVPSCISASHVAFASARMEPVFMMLGEAAGRAAAMAADEDVAVQQIDVNTLQGYLISGYH